MSESLLVARVAGERVAFPVTAIATTHLIEQVHPVPGAPAFVAGLMANRSQTLTVIDTVRALGLESADALPEYCIVFVRHGCSYAFAVEAIEAVVEVIGPTAPPRGKLAEGWARAAVGQVETTAGAVLLVDWEKLLSAPQQAAA
ncbi:MAG: chemotaxis protein CheW [Novosphingobium sp.]